MTSHHTIRVPKAQLDELNWLCRHPDGSVGRGEVVFDQTAVFGDKKMAIQVVASEEPDKESCWTQGVLFDYTGTELAFTEVGEDLDGEFVIQYEGDTYEVWVLPEVEIAGVNC